MFQRWPGRIGAVLTALACACLCTAPAWSQAALVPNAIQQFFDANGNPLSSGFVYFYVPGTTSPKTVWQDAGQTIPYSNPIQLNAAGEPNNAAGIWGAGNYRQIIQDQLQNLIWDAVTSTPGTSSGGGGTSGDGMPIGFIMAYAGPSAPTGYDFAYGQSYLRSGFPTLLSALTITENGTCTNGSGNITALSDTSQMGVGQAIESTCLPPGTTISAILSSSSVSVSALATGISGTYSLQVFPFGNGNGATTFQLPDLRGYGLAGRDNMGGTAANVLTANTRTNGWNLLGAVGGMEALTLAAYQVPSHSHEILVTDPGHAHAFTYGTTAAGSGGAAQITQIDALGDTVLTGTQVQATGITATAVASGGGSSFTAVLGAPTSQALASGTVSFGGSSYTNGASVSLTVLGGTCGTQPVVLATVSGNRVTAINSVATPGTCTVPPANPAALSDGTHTTATIVGTYGNGSGYTTGSQTLTVLGGTCSVQPQFTVSVAGGSVTAVLTQAVQGVCTTPPVNPAATSGGGGTGATLAVSYTNGLTAIVQPTVTINYVIKVNTNSGGFTVPIANNTVVGNDSGFTNPPTAITAPAVLAMVCNTRGAILEDSALGWGCVSPGTNGYVWTSNGAGADPSYQPVAGASGSVTGPGSSVLNGLVCWANAFGSVLENCGAQPWVQAGVYAAGSTGAFLTAVRGTTAVPNTDGVATAIVQSVTNFAGTAPALYASTVKRGTQGAMAGAYGMAAWGEAVDVVGGGSISGGRWSAACSGGTGGNCSGATDLGVCTVSYAFCIGTESQAWNNVADATTTFSAAKFASPVLSTCAGTKKCDVAFLANPNVVAPNVAVTPFIYGVYFPAGTMDSTGSVLYSAATSAFGANFLNCTCVPFRSTNYQVDNLGNVTANSAQVTELLATGAAATAAAGQISYGGTTVSPGTGTCPTGTVGGATVVGCIVVNIAGTARNVPFF